MRREIETINVEGIGLVAFMDERTGWELYKRLSEKTTQFSPLSRKEACTLVDLFTETSLMEEENGYLLKSPFSPDMCGSRGDCIICREDGRIFNLSVSCRGRIRFDRNAENGCFAYGGGVVAIKVNKPINFESRPYVSKY